MKRYKGKVERTRKNNSIRFTFEDISSEKLVKMYDHLKDYMRQNNGSLDSVSWQGMPGNPVKVEKNYKVKSLEMVVASKRDKHDKGLHNLMIEFTSKHALDPVVHCLMQRFFVKFLPEGYD